MVITLVLADDTYHQLEQAAKAAGCSPVAIIIRATQVWLDRFAATLTADQQQPTTREDAAAEAQRQLPSLPPPPPPPLPSFIRRPFSQFRVGYGDGDE